MRILNGVLYDIKFQLRHGFYYVYLFISIVYIVSLMLLPESIRKVAEILILFSDPGVLGAFFIGAIFLLEKSQNTLQGIFITPYKIQEYILAKVISLTILSLLSSFLISIITRKGAIHAPLLFLAIVFTSIFYTLLGLTIAVYSKTINHYFINSSLVVIFMLPVVEYFSTFSTPLFYILPGKASLLLLYGAFENISIFNLIYALTLLIVWSFAAYLLCAHVFYKKVILRIGE